MRWKNPFKKKEGTLREIVTQPVTSEADRVALARKARAQAEAKRSPKPPEPEMPKEANVEVNVEPDALQKALAARMQHVAIDEKLGEVLGKKIIAAIQSEPVPPAVIVYVLEMLKETVIGQQRARDAAKQA